MEQGSVEPRARIGFVLLSTDAVAERDMFRWAPEDVGLHFTRIAMPGAVTVDNLACQLDQLESCAALLMPNDPPKVICYGCTSGGVVMGPPAVIERLQRGQPGVPATTLVSCVLDGLAALNVSRIALATPYIDEINQLEAAFFETHGYPVVNFEGLQILHDADIARVPSDEVKRFARNVDVPEAEALFISCSGFRAFEIAQALEDELGKPVVTSNQAMLWRCLRLAGIPDPIPGAGRLLQI